MNAQQRPGFQTIELNSTINMNAHHGLILWVREVQPALQTLRYTSDDFDDPEGSLPFDFMKTKCRTRSRLISTMMKANVEYVTAQLESTVVLLCHFCYEESNTARKIWYYSPRENGPDLNSDTEVKLGMHDDESKNHFSQRTDSSLVINNVSTSDTGYYYCHGIKGEEAEYKFNFMVDVINGSTGAVIGDRDDWRTYKSNTYPDLKLKIARKMLYAKDASGHKHEFYFHAIPEWTSWSSCDGCIGLRSKKAVCKLVPTPTSNLKRKAEHRKMAAASTIRTSTTAKPPGNHSKLNYLLFEYGIACQSLDLDEARPDISIATKEIRPFILVEPCTAVCSHPRRNQPKFKDTITLQEGEHITLVCPESTMNSAVEWRKDGVLISKRTATDDTDHILVDTFSNLYITYARDVESGSYICYVNGDKIQEVAVSVNAEAVRKQAAFLKHMHYLGFMLMFGVIFYVAGVIVAWTQRHTFKTIDFDMMDKEEMEGNRKNINCNKTKGPTETKEFALSRKLEEKFVHI